MSVTHELGEVVAERRLEAVAEDGTRTPVIVRLGTPEPDPHPEARGDWHCPRQILGLGDEAVATSYGVDSLQAFLLSVYATRLQLEERARVASVRLNWLGQEGLGLEVDPRI
ncbi:DUF6968 family protein [Nocardiopsis algeriensis]|uniref:DUF6968 domain-containing protein n=1 Tax=Nocardiopsis algeriensis TaxID=1478215 RepID=A0A841IR04_9ACTN|nr:hypothetical protein [Nocardiopsis algeriensis]MBB6121117.1 hypothetical protein [Nocardiopsis algeriensis]